MERTQSIEISETNSLGIIDAKPAHRDSVDYSSYIKKPVYITDHACDINDLQKLDYLENASRDTFKTLTRLIHLSNPLEGFFLLLFSVIITLVCFAFDSLLEIAMGARLALSTTGNSLLNICSWVFSSLVLLLLANACCYLISPKAEGSGIPELRTVVSGIKISKFLSVRTLLAKVTSLFATLLGGSSTGKVGPFVHISSIVCNRLLKWKVFSKMNSSVLHKNAMLLASAAAGITLSLGTPIGGVIFSMEVTSTFYLTSNLAKAFVCSTFCVIISKLLNYTAKNMYLFESPDHLEPLGDAVASDLFFFLLLGVVCGLIGAALSIIVSRVSFIRKKSQWKLLNNRFYYSALVAVLVSSVSFACKPLMIDDRFMLSHIFNVQDPKDDIFQFLRHRREGFMLLLLALLKFTITVFSLAMNVPAGVIAPFFLIGGFFGRFYGHFLNSFLNLSHESIYALIGAAAVMSGATHSISSSVMIFELTGQSSYFLPLLFSCLVANMSAQAISSSFYDAYLAIKNLPFLTSIKSLRLYSFHASDFLSAEVYPTVLEKFTYINALELLVKAPEKYFRNVPIPVLDSQGTIIWTVQGKKLFKYLYRVYFDFKLNLDEGVDIQLETCLKYLESKFCRKNRGITAQLKHKLRKLTRRRSTGGSCKRRHDEGLKANNILVALKESAISDSTLLNCKIDPSDAALRADKSSLTVDKSFPYLKLQFLFTFLSLKYIFITSNSMLIGVLTKEEFVKKSTAIG